MDIQQLPSKVKSMLRVPQDANSVALRTPKHFVFRIIGILLIPTLSSVAVFAYQHAALTVIIGLLVISVVLVVLFLHMIYHELILDFATNQYLTVYSLKFGNQFILLRQSDRHDFPKPHQILLSNKGLNVRISFLDSVYSDGSLSEYAYLALYLSSKTGWKIVETATDGLNLRTVTATEEDVKRWLNEYQNEQIIIKPLWNKRAIFKLISPILILIVIDSLY
ncbi:hypothetical protein [Aliikangiella sp. IMCC44632]